MVTMGAAWASEQLDRLDTADELQIAVRREDGTLRRWLPIWVVRVEDTVYLRTWHRRDTGWFGHVLSTRRARVRVPGIEVDVAVEEVGDGATGLRAAVDAAVASTLRLVPERLADEEAGARPELLAYF
jgi:hypothetical protein